VITIDDLRFRYRLARSDAIRLVKGYAARISGYDEHMRQEHPPSGLLTVGPLTFTISRVVFRDGRMVLHATAGTDQAGRMKGEAVISGTDGLPVLHGDHRVQSMGVKTAGSTWTFVYTLDLRNIRAENAEIQLEEMQ
jgi:hypothetical protein